ncbi:DUF4232 domain-containing protein [Embleya scabrispora]|uniref:DUF4232 domain-containing protein n=1 Tax=Embleya scabrispora TaxID=159449 RepID=UPI000371B419|nr:DUF4232 domain-containing protein [Embleya scabrispora]MYS83455.1 DUF4232 domain-containing protein [Streptomyces sp. SID5474]
MSGNRRKALLVSAALVGAMLMTACQDTDSGNAAKGSSPAPPAAGAATPPGSASNGAGTGTSTGGNQSGGGNSTGKDSAGKSSSGQTTTAGTGAGDNGSIGKCRTDDLKITAMDSTIGGDANGTVAVTFKNIGHNCTMSGFAGVDLETSQGPLSAKRTGQPADAFTLKSDKSVSFGINYPTNDSGGSGVRITGLKVTPPGETKSVTLRWPGAATLAVTDGSGSPINVGPIGSAGQGG